MKNNKVNFVVDGNLIFHTMVSIKPEGWLSDGKHITDMALAVHQMVGSALQRLTFDPIRIVFVLDSLNKKTWRKSYDHVTGVKYKDNRKKRKARFDKKTMEMAMTVLMEFYNRNTIHTVCIDEAEGDDSMFLISRRFWANDESTLLLTGDSDMRQILLHDEESHKFVAIMDSHKDFIFVTSYNPTPVEYDMFSETSILDTMTETKSSYVYVEPDSFIVKKMIAGDKGDNVPPAYMYINTKDTNSVMDDGDHRIIYDTINRWYGSTEFEVIYGSDLCKDGMMFIGKTKIACEASDTSYSKSLVRADTIDDIEMPEEIEEVISKYTKRNKCIHLFFSYGSLEKMMRYSPGAKIFGFSDKRAQRIDPYLIPSPNQLLKEGGVRRSLVRVMMDQMGHKSTERSVIENAQRIEDNVKVMWLDHSTIPDRVVDRAEERFSEILNEDHVFDHSLAIEMFCHPFFGTDNEDDMYEDAHEVRSSKPKVWHNIKQVEDLIIGGDKKVEKKQLESDDDFLW